MLAESVAATGIELFCYSGGHCFAAIGLYF